MKKRSRQHAKEIVGKLKCVTFVVNDLQGVRTFYVEQLGLPIEHEELDYVMVNGGPFSLCLDKGEKGEVSGDAAHLIFVVPDLDMAAKELRRRGVNYELRKDEHGKYLQSHDPEGREIVFAENL